MHNLTNETLCKKALAPEAFIKQFPLTSDLYQSVKNHRISINNILKGFDKRLLMVIGPCSIHDLDSAKEYAAFLKQTSQLYESKFLIVMRTFFEKPRTTVGWKGLISDPFLDGTFAIHSGLALARELLCHIGRMGLPTSTEFLDTLVPPFLSDLISLGIVGARTTESSIHRALASGLNMPVGFKNNTDGNIQVAIDAIQSASEPHHFLGLDLQGMINIIHTLGNPACHLILRGSNAGPNYSEKNVKQAINYLKNANLNSRIVIDCSHGNSMKNPSQQFVVIEEICRQIKNGSTAIAGVMIESNLVGGRQEISSKKNLIYGKSITDACLGWDETLSIIKELANVL